VEEKLEPGTRGRHGSAAAMAGSLRQGAGSCWAALEPLGTADRLGRMSQHAADASSVFRGLKWPLRTQRLILRPAELDDAEALWVHRGLPEVGRWLGWHPVDRADWRITYPEKYRDYLVVEHEGRVIGDLMLRIGDGWGQREVKAHTVGVQAELGWTFAPEAGGRGLATEAVEALLAVCFEDLGLRRVEAGAFAANEPSWKLMERVGMRRESYSVKESLHRELGWLDGVLYALLADEWRARRDAAPANGEGSRAGGTLQ
jgi:RimJ/RimL family protein N-acetyltransferase